LHIENRELQRLQIASQGARLFRQSNSSVNQNRTAIAQITPENPGISARPLRSFVRWIEPVIIHGSKRTIGSDG
jgi:hypothetical protein